MVSTVTLALTRPVSRQTHEHEPDQPLRGHDSQIRFQLLRIDPLLLLAGVGLALCSVITLHGAGFRTDAEKQALYAGGGLLLALLLSRFDYSLLREYRYVFYALALLINLAVAGFPPEPRIGGRTPLDPAARLLIPILGVRQAAADRLALCVRRRSFAADERTSNRGARDAAGAGAGDDSCSKSRATSEPGLYT